MTPDDLQELVLAGTAGPLVDALAPLYESARRTLSKRAFELYQAANDFERKSDLSNLMGNAGPLASRNAELAVLACCDGAKARRLQLISPDEEGMLAVLLARKPAWINGWINHQIDKRWVPGNWWPVVRGLVRAGIAAKPAPATYINLMVNGIAWRNRRKGAQQVPLSTLLLEDRDLLETEVWQLFETDHRAFAKDYLAASPRRPENHETWAQALMRLAQAGHIDRARLIDTTLNGMASGLKPSTIGGIINFAEALEISTEELSPRQGILCQLLANQIGTAVSFALEGLNRLEKAKLLDREGLLEMIEPPLLFPKKSQANAAIALLKLMAKNDESRRPRCLVIAARALSNVSEDVQRRATELIEMYPDNSDGLLRESLSAQIGSVAPTIRDRLSVLSMDVDGQGDGDVSPSADLGIIEIRVSHLPAKVIQRWGIKQAIDDWRAGEVPLAWPKVASEETDYQPLASIASPDELLEAIALAVESVSGADEIERLIDGVARFADRRPDSRVAETIFKRFLTPTSMKGLTSSLGVPPQLVKLVGMWFGVDVTSGKTFNEPESWWTARFEPHLTALRKGRAWQPLSTPTHAGGWIDPCVWVARLSGSGEFVNDSDAIQSLLRLAPFRRAEARESLGNVPSGWRRLAEYALGGERRAGITDVFRSPLWVAAGRARQPAGDLKELQMLLSVSNVPDALRESQFRLQERPDQPPRRRSHNSESTYLPLDPSFDADVNKKMDHIPQCLFYPRKSTQRFSLEWLSPWVIELKSQIRPTNLRGFLYLGINRMLQRFESSSSVYEPNHVYVDVLRPHQRSFGDVEHMALAIACMSGEQEVRRSAGEVLVRAGIEGRLDARLFAATLHELYQKRWFSINRLATTLGVAARDSPQTARVIVETLVAFLAHQQELPKGAHDVLDVLYQQSHRLGISVPEPIKRKLFDQRGQTKTTRLSKDLIDLQVSPSRASTAGLEGIKGLLERAEAQRPLEGLS
jgi:Arc/MetJ-type ribon-helix-helix transcriptional regulator